MGYCACGGSVDEKSAHLRLLVDLRRRRGVGASSVLTLEEAALDKLLSRSRGDWKPLRFVEGHPSPTATLRLHRRGFRRRGGFLGLGHFALRDLKLFTCFLSLFGDLGSWQVCFLYIVVIPGLLFQLCRFGSGSSLNCSVSQQIPHQWQEDALPFSLV